MDRISIGFSGGGGLALRVASDELEGLRKAVKGGGGWHDVATDEGTVSIKVAEVVYLRTENSESKVGFGL